MEDMRQYTPKAYRESPEEAKKQCLAVIHSTAEELAKATDECNRSGMDVQFRFLCEQFRRLDMIERRMTIRG